jgi:HAMP domain-containing protein
MDGYLLAARPWNKALGFLNQLLLDLALVFAVAIVIAVSAGFFMSRSLAEGIELLVKGIREVSRGVLSHRVEVSGKDELAEAGRAFNEMVDSLEKHRIIDQVWNKEWNEKTGRDDND